MSIKINSSITILYIRQEAEIINSARELLARTLQETEIQIKFKHYFFLLPEYNFIAFCGKFF